MEVTKAKKLAAIWKDTHRDFRGTLPGGKTIMILRNGGSCLVPLDALTDEEIERRYEMTLPRDFGVRAKMANGNTRTLTDLSEKQAKAQYAGFLGRGDCEYVEYLPRGS